MFSFSIEAFHSQDMQTNVALFISSHRAFSNEFHLLQKSNATYIYLRAFADSFINGIVIWYTQCDGVSIFELKCPWMCLAMASTCKFVPTISTSNEVNWKHHHMLLFVYENHTVSLPCRSIPQGYLHRAGNLIQTITLIKNVNKLCFSIIFILFIQIYLIQSLKWTSIAEQSHYNCFSYGWIDFHVALFSHLIFFIRLVFYLFINFQYLSRKWCHTNNLKLFNIDKKMGKEYFFHSFSPFLYIYIYFVLNNLVAKNSVRSWNDH